MILVRFKRNRQYALVVVDRYWKCPQKMANLWTKLFLTTTYPQKQAFLWIKPRGNSPRLHSAMPLGLKSAFLRQRRLSEGRWGSNWPNLSPGRPCEAGGEGQSGLESAFLRPRRPTEGRWGSNWPNLSPRRPCEAGGEGQSGLKSAFLRPRQHLRRLSGSKEPFLRPQLT